ncbi:hypothetical protein O6H91_15G068200 [Diphasiastrum complanatum]|uniref:Uncharacterized protein n=1 Tax=Diphasiastrum complanatum TaxID=34168 RepID=A0ACC2BJ98_DIPCM|nr:hypothetical protein O6H91_15G068200 [Diphasiastrum complanatum]
MFDGLGYFFQYGSMWPEAAWGARIAWEIERIWAFALMAFLLFLSSNPANCTISQSDEVDQSGLGDSQQYPTENGTVLDFNLYHRSDQLLQDISALVSRHPMMMTEKVWKSVVVGYSTEMTIVTVEPGGRRPNLERRLRVLLNFGQHARELVTSEVALRLLKILAGEHDLRNRDITPFNQLLTNMILKVVPMENVNGRKKVEKGDLCERKNGRGVDTNRNWGVDWGKKEKDYDPYEEYPGTAAFSEPETQILREVAASFKPHLWVNVHSGMQALFMPYDHKNMTPDEGSRKPMESLLKMINALHCKGNCIVGSGGGTVGYFAHGTATDYMYSFLKVPIAFTFEIYGDDVAQDDCYPMFNPTSPALLESTIMNWCEAFFTLFMKLPTTLRSIFNATTGHSYSNLDLLASTPLSDAGSQQQLEVDGVTSTYVNRKGQTFWLPIQENNVFLEVKTEGDWILAELFYISVGLGSVILCFTAVKWMLSL